MAPDLQQNIIITLYLLFTHNYIAFAYLSGLAISVVLSFYRPSRFTTLTTVAFGILLFSYEYDKHVIAGLREQTINSLITTTPHYRVQRIVDLVLTDVLPVLFYISGWALLYIAIFYASKRIHKK